MSSPYLGEIRIYAGIYEPSGWAFCDGRLLPINQYEALFSLVGTTYGGDGRTNFGLPNLRGRLVIGTGAANGDVNNGGTSAYALAQTGGATTVTLTPSQLPNHTHTLYASTAAPIAQSPNQAMLADPADNFNMYCPWSQTGINRVLANDALLAQGGGESHNNVMPCKPLNYIISLLGIYPNNQ